MTTDNEELPIDGHPQTIPSCSFCGISQDKVQRLIAGPGNHYICDACIDQRRKTLEDQYLVSPPNSTQNVSSQPETSNPNAPTQTIHNCSFCGKAQDQVQYLIAGPGNHYICNECIDVRRKALEDQYLASSPNSAQNVSSQPETSNPNAPAQKIHNCSFCGKTQDQVQYLIAGTGNHYICNECIDQRRKALEDQYLASSPHLDQNTNL